jgi:hypothetical protein
MTRIGDGLNVVFAALVDFPAVDEANHIFANLYSG